MGSLRFELRSLHPERNRMVQATLRPRNLSLVRIEIVYNLLMRQQHPPAAITVHAEIVEDLFGILAGITALFKLFKCWGNNFSAGETSDRYHISSIS
jgi:hypothetical protein